MKTKLIMMTALLSLAFIASASDEKTQTKEIEVTVEKEGDNFIKKVIVNGKELTAEEIAEMEASGELKTIHTDSDHKVMIIKSDGSEHAHGDMKKHVKIIKKHSGDMDDEDVQVFIDKIGDKTTEKITVNGKELSEDEIAEFKASGKMKVINIDADMADSKGHKMMFINSDSELGEDIDIEVIMEKVKGLKGGDIDESMIQEWVGDDGKNIKIIKKGFVSVDDDSASLGFIAIVKDDGWHLTKIMDKSGAKDVGILVGDIVTRIGNVDLTRNSDSEKVSFHQLPKFEEGEIVKVDAIRAGQPITFNVQARKLDKSTVLAESDGNFSWVEEFHESGDFPQNIKVMVFDGKDGEFKLNTDDINMVFPENFENMNFFVSDGHSTSKLLGKNHEMSSLSDDLGKYFNTQGGVLVLHVDESNVFKLKDGDVIKSINDNQVNSPKDVVKQLIKADDQEKIKMEVVRNKKSKTLKYEK